MSSLTQQPQNFSSSVFLKTSRLALPTSASFKPYIYCKGWIFTLSSLTLNHPTLVVLAVSLQHLSSPVHHKSCQFWFRSSVFWPLLPPALPSLFSSQPLSPNQTALPLSQLFSTPVHPLLLILLYHMATAPSFSTSSGLLAHYSSPLFHTFPHPGLLTLRIWNAAEKQSPWSHIRSKCSSLCFLNRSLCILLLFFFPSNWPDLTCPTHLSWATFVKMHRSRRALWCWDKFTMWQSERFTSMRLITFSSRPQSLTESLGVQGEPFERKCGDVLHSVWREKLKQQITPKIKD